MQVSLLMLTRGPVSLATMVSEPGSYLLAVGSGRAGNDYLFYIGCWRWRMGLSQFFLEWNLLPWIIRAHKIAPKNHKNTNNSYLDI
jgi:hypothetical protein